VVGELDEGHLFPLGEGVARRRDDDEVLLEEERHLDVGVVDGEVQQGEVEAAGGEGGEQGGGVALERRHPDVGVALRHGHEEGRHQPPPRGADDAQADAAGHVGAQRGDVGHQGGELARDPAAPGDHHLALLGEAAGGPVDEDDAELALEPGHMRAHVRLHGVEHVGGGRERPRVGDGGERSELAEVHHDGRYPASKRCVGQMWGRRS
jgi:hypothetical protein